MKRALVLLVAMLGLVLPTTGVAQAAVHWPAGCVAAAPTLVMTATNVTVSTKGITCNAPGLTLIRSTIWVRWTINGKITDGMAPVHIKPVTAAASGVFTRPAGAVLVQGRVVYTWMIGTTTSVTQSGLFVGWAVLPPGAPATTE